eukprot:31210-Pelagococcus_subviridis.AAC.14
MLRSHRLDVNRTLSKRRYEACAPKPRRPGRRRRIRKNHPTFRICRRPGFYASSPRPRPRCSPHRS